MVVVGGFGGVGWGIYTVIKGRQYKAGQDYESGFSSFFRVSLESMQLFKEMHFLGKKSYFKRLLSCSADQVTGAQKVNGFLGGVPGIVLEYFVIVVLVGVVYGLVVSVGDLASFGTLFIFYAVVGRRLLDWRCRGAR